MDLEEENRLLIAKCQSLEKEIASLREYIRQALVKAGTDKGSVIDELLE